MRYITKNIFRIRSFLDINLQNMVHFIFGRCKKLANSNDMSPKIINHSGIISTCFASNQCTFLVINKFYVYYIRWNKKANVNKLIVIQNLSEMIAFCSKVRQIFQFRAMKVNLQFWIRSTILFALLKWSKNWGFPF